VRFLLCIRKASSVEQIIVWAGAAGGFISVLFGGGYLVSRARRERDWGDAFATLRRQVADIAADLEELRHDFDALQWAVTQEPHDTRLRIFEAARVRRRRGDKDAGTDKRD
jgi:hypothetical protein